MIPAVTEKALEAIITRLKARGIPGAARRHVRAAQSRAGLCSRFDAIYPELAQKHGLVLYPFFLEGIAGDRVLNQPDHAPPHGRGRPRHRPSNILPTVERFLATLPAKILITCGPSARPTSLPHPRRASRAVFGRSCLAMEYRRLGRTDLKVSVICLGTMTWGEQNTEAEGHEQMDYALDQGVNFFDTAELYSIPPKAETQGSTERIIGNWFKARGNRDKVILASKSSGAAAR